MLSQDHFDVFLKSGIISGAMPGASMKVLLETYGDNAWIVKENEHNGLIYGVIKVGITEFHIYNEVISGYSFRPDLPFEESDYKNGSIPWIIKSKCLSEIELQLEERNIRFKKYSVKGPSEQYQRAGVVLGLGEGQHTFIDTDGGVTFLFDDIYALNPETNQICKYYSPIYSKSPFCFEGP